MWKDSGLIPNSLAKKDDIKRNVKYDLYFFRWIFVAVVLGTVGGVIGFVFHLMIDERTKTVVRSHQPFRFTSAHVKQPYIKRIVIGIIFRRVLCLCFIAQRVRYRQSAFLKLVKAGGLIKHVCHSYLYHPYTDEHAKDKNYQNGKHLPFDTYSIFSKALMAEFITSIVFSPIAISASDRFLAIFSEFINIFLFSSSFSSSPTFNFASFISFS